MQRSPSLTTEIYTESALCVCVCVHMRMCKRKPARTYTRTRTHTHAQSQQTHPNLEYRSQHFFFKLIAWNLVNFCLCVDLNPFPVHFRDAPGCLNKSFSTFKSCTNILIVPRFRNPEVSRKQKLYPFQEKSYGASKSTTS